ncbi:MAG: putative Outer rane efflux protein precursor [Fibrobacteres bacterium]|nr:putative Outer rane efflux protein precursor [Fibrobacterota bacterium]
MPSSFHPILKSAAAITAIAGAFLLPAAAGAEPLTLEAALREGLTKSEEVLILKEKENRFEALRSQAWAGAFPRVSAYANAGRGASPFDLSSLGFSGGDTTGGKTAQATPSVINVAQNRFSYGLQAEQSIFSFGRLGQAIRTANIQDQADRSSRRRSVQQLQLQVLDAYYGAVTSQARLGTLESAVKRQRETVNFLESNFKMGAGQRSIVLLAITSLKSLEPQRIRAERDAEAARMSLNRVLGRPLEAPLDLDTASHIAMDPVKSLPDSQALQALISERADIQSMELQQKSLEGQAKYIKMQYLPSVGAQGKVGVLAFKLNQLGEIDDNREWSVGVGLNWTLFDGFGLRSQARQIQSDARSLGLTTRQTRKMVQIEIESAFREYQAADTALSAAEQAVAAAKEAQALLSQDFRAGKGQLTDLLTAEQSLREAEFGVLGARYQHVRSAAAMRLAMGKGLINEEVP